MKAQGRKYSLRERLMMRQSRRRIFVWAILIPVLAWFMVYMFIPLVSVVVYSFTNAKMQYPDMEFVALDNYVKMFTADPLLPIALQNTIVAVLIIMPGVLILSVLLAAGMNAASDKLREAFTFFYFLPSVVPLAAVSLVWMWLYHPQYGLFNALFGVVGLGPFKYLQDSGSALISICVVQIWYTFGYYAVILLAAMRGISPDIYEAADLDGVGPIARFFRITLPLIKPNLIFVSIMSTISAFMLFTPVDVLTFGRGTPGTSTMVLMLKAKIDGIQLGDTGYASAISILMLAIILAVSLVQWLLSSEGKRGGTRG